MYLCDIVHQDETLTNYKTVFYFQTRVDMNYDYDRKMTVNVYRDLGNMKIILDYRVVK